MLGLLVDVVSSVYIGRGGGGGGIVCICGKCILRRARDSFCCFFICVEVKERSCLCVYIGNAVSM